jgi:hypothetical protein
LDHLKKENLAEKAKMSDDDEKRVSKQKMIVIIRRDKETKF